MYLPAIENHWALFLDLDGTLLDIAEAPQEVTIPHDLVEMLERVRVRLDGALAIVSGRRLDDIDRLLMPVKFAGAAEHGAIIRFDNGDLVRASCAQLPARWLHALEEKVRDWPGVLLENKPSSITIHYRLCPHYEVEVRAFVMSLVQGICSDFKVVPSRMALEIRPKGITKGHAVKMLADRHPFRGRTPVFVGDDVTDEDGMTMARQLGGFGLHVASFFGGKPSEVRDWVRRAIKPNECGERQ